MELNVRAKYGCNIVAIKREGDINVSPLADEIIKTGDVVIVIGADTDINRLERAWFDNV